MDDRLEGLLRRKLREAGRQYARAREAYDEGRDEAGDDTGTDGSDEVAAAIASLPRDDEGRARLVCRREADRRAVAVDDQGRPACFEAGHPDCEGCVEDVRAGIVETW